MKLILQEDVKNLGRAGDTVNVANGFGRNYLLPKKMAIAMTPANLKCQGPEETWFCLKC